MKSRKIRLWLIFGSSTALFGFCLVAWLAGGKLLTPANRDIGPPPENLPVETYSIESASGSTLAAWYIPTQKARATIILLHPIRSDRQFMLGRARLLHAAGFTIVMIDMQAHGESPGEYITAGHLERHDVHATIEFARNKNPNHKIGVIGCSLGGAATLLASPLDIDALVLEAVYPTISEAIHNRISMRLGPLSYVLTPALLCQLQPRVGISPSELRPINHIADIECPILVAAGSLDEHTTLAETQRLYDTAKDPKQLAIFEGAAHTDLLAYNPTQYEDQILPFFDTYLESSQIPSEPED